MMPLEENQTLKSSQGVGLATGLLLGRVAVNLGVIRPET